MNVSFKPIVHLHRQRKDGNYSVMIRIGFKSEYAFIETGFSVPKSALNRKGEIKNLTILDGCNKLISEYRELTYLLPDIATMNVQAIKSFILEGKSLKTPLNYSKLFRQYLEENKNSPSKSIYSAAYNHLTDFFGNDVMVNDITPVFLQRFENYLSGRMGSRGVELYLSRIRAVYNWIMDEYEYKGYSFRYPFRKYKIPRSVRNDVEALSKEQLLAIINTPLRGVRANRSRDLFVISLLSLGTNAKDLFLLESFDDRMVYKRSKTRKIRKDEAKISIKIEPELRPYLEKYKGHNRALIFSEWYSSPKQLNRMNIAGLSSVSSQIRSIYGKDFIGHLEFYDARRSFASALRNKLGFSVDDVALCLNHVDSGKRITNLYIERDWSVIDKANRAFIDWLFH